MENERILKEIIVDITPYKCADSGFKQVTPNGRMDEGLNGFELVGAPYHPSEYTIVSALPHPYL